MTEDETNERIDPGERTVEQLQDELREIDSPNELEGILDAEKDGQQRKTAQEAIRARMRAVSEDEAVEEDTETEGKYRETADEADEEPAAEDETAGLALDPSEYDIAEFGPAIKEVEDADELEAILDAEESGENRDNVKTLIESRIEKVTEGEEVEGEDDIDPTELSTAELGNALRRIDDIERLEAVLEAEQAGEARSAATNLIESRIESVQESEEEGEIEVIPPEEKHPNLDHPTADKQYVKALEDGVYRDMWVYCETQAGELIDVSKEMLGKARELMDTYNDDYDTDEQVVAVLIGSGVEKHTEDVLAYGADVVVYHEDSRLERFQHKPYTELFCDMARAGATPGEGDSADTDWRDYDEPRYTVFPATNNGRDLSALAQGELDSGLASDCSDLYIEEAMISNPVKTGRPGTNKEFERVLHMKRPDFSGFEYSTILCLDNPTREFHPQGASVIPGSFDLPEPDADREGEVVEHEHELDDEWLRVSVTEYDRLDEGVDLTGHDVVVAMGRGIGDNPTEGMELGIELTNAFDDAGLGVSRGIVTGSYEFAGHVEQYTAEERQIGETGQVVEPELYIAAGISGAVQHKVGMDNSEIIVAVNTDPDARIRDFSDYFIEGDLFEVLPRLTEALKAGELDMQKIASDGGANDE